MPGDATRGLRTYDGRQPVVAAIDGNPATAAVLVMLAEQFGCRALAAHSVEAGLALLKREPVVDLVAIDFAIPDMDPFVAAQLIRTLGKRGAMPIVAIADAASAGQRTGPICFSRTVAKPYSPRELFAAFETALARVAEPALPLT